MQEPAQPQIIDGGIAAHILISRFVDHLPYYRQETINARIVSEPAMARNAHGQWCREGRLYLAAGTTYKRARLLAGRGTHCHVAIAPQGPC